MIPLALAIALTFQRLAARELIGRPTAIAAAAIAALSLAWYARSAPRTIVYTAYLLLTTEAGLQLLAAGGVLPGVDLVPDVPYGRLYWSSEGRGNGIMNRHGWYAPSFRLAPRSRRIAIIGDSFVLGAEVQRHQGMGPRLQELYPRAGAIAVEVLPLGIGGAGPAHYLDMLDYAVSRFQPGDAVIVIYLGNDIRNASYRVQSGVAEGQPERYPYYRLDDSGAVVLDPRSAAARQRFRARLDRRDALWINLSRMLSTHFFLLNSVDTIVRSAVRPRTPSEGPDPSPMNAFVFRRPPPPEAVEAFAIVEGLLGRCQELCRRSGVRLRLMTVPYWPHRFYEEPARGSGWQTVAGEFDWLQPERELLGWAAATGIPLLPLGQQMRSDGLNLEQVRALYFLEGTGHLTQQGHLYAARALWRSLESGAVR